MNVENPITKEEKRTYWANHVKQWNASGKSQSDYCRHNKLKLHQLVYWKQVFGTHLKPKSNPSSKNGFVAIQLERSSMPRAQEMTIQLPNGIRIESAQSNNLDMIREMTRWQI